MSTPAHVESVTGAPRSVWIPATALAAWASVMFALAGALGSTLGAWVPDIGVLLLIAVTARSSGNAPLIAALSVSAGRIAVGIDPPLAVLAAYIAVAGVHAAVGAIIDADRLAVRLIASALSAAWVVGWLCAVHELRGAHALDLLARAPGMALRTALTTALVAPIVVPLLRRLPGASAMGVSR